MQFEGATRLVDEAWELHVGKDLLRPANLEVTRGKLRWVAGLVAASVLALCVCR